MRKTSHFITFLLVMAVSTATLPLFNSTDVAHDGTVDLQDAILLVQDIATSADDTSSLYGSLSRAVLALKVVAGLEASPLNNDDSQSAPAQSSPDHPTTLPYLTAVPDLKVPVSGYTALLNYSSYYQSITIPPPHRPPVSC